MAVNRFLPALGLTAVLAMAGCAAPPPVSEKVQKYYDENVSKQTAATATATATATPVAPAQRAVFIGESYAQGSGSSGPTSRWTSKLSLDRGWREQNIARGGTGYLATPTAPKTACGLDYCPTFEEMIPEAVKGKPDLVIVSGGRDDVVFRYADFVSAADRFYSELRGALPNARIVAVSPVWDSSTPPAQLAAYGDAIRAAVTAVKGVYVDVKQPMVGHSDWITPDGAGANDAGHAAIYAALRDALPTK